MHILVCAWFSNPDQPVTGLFPSLYAIFPTKSMSHHYVTSTLYQLIKKTTSFVRNDDTLTISVKQWALLCITSVCKIYPQYMSAERLAGFTQIFMCSDSWVLQKKHLLSACTQLRSFIWIWRRKKFNSNERFLISTGLINWKMRVCQNWHCCTELD